MKYSTKPFFGFSLIIALIIMISCLIFWHYTTSPITLEETQCVPIIYPEGSFIELERDKTLYFETNASIEEVSAFYQELLMARPFDSPVYISGQWRVQPREITNLLYDCYNAIDMFTEETGCIALQERNGGTSIKLNWSTGELAPGCPGEFYQNE